MGYSVWGKEVLKILQDAYHSETANSKDALPMVDSMETRVFKEMLMSTKAWTWGACLPSYCLRRMQSDTIEIIPNNTERISSSQSLRKRSSYLSRLESLLGTFGWESCESVSFRRISCCGFSMRDIGRVAKTLRLGKPI